MSASLFVYIGEGEGFEPESIRRFLQGRPEVSKNRACGREGAIQSAEFQWQGDHVFVDLKSDLQTIVISGIGPASLRAAWLLQQSHSVPLRIFDDGYAFDLRISDYATEQEFAGAACNALGGRADWFDSIGSS